MYIYDLVVQSTKNPEFKYFSVFLWKVVKTVRGPQTLKGVSKPIRWFHFRLLLAHLQAKPAKPDRIKHTFARKRGGGIWILPLPEIFCSPPPKKIPCQMECFGPIAILSMLNWLCVLSLIQCINKFYNKII